MPFHSDVTMETINDIFPPLDPPIGPDLESSSFMGMGNGILESSFPPLSPSPTMPDSMLDDNDDLNTLALGDHPFMELTSGIHIKQEYEDEEEDTSYQANHHQPPTPTPAPQVKTSQPSMIRGLLDQPTNIINRHVNGVTNNGLATALTNGHHHTATTHPLQQQHQQQMYHNTDIHSLLNATKIKVEPKEEEVSEDENMADSEDDDEDEDEDGIDQGDEDGDTTGGSTISSVISSTMSSAVSSAAATPVVSPAHSPAPVVTSLPQQLPTPPTTTTTAPLLTNGAVRNGQASPATTNHTGQSPGWSSGREKRSNRWTASTPAATSYVKVEKKELRKRKPTSYALLREDPLPSKKKRSYNFRQFRRTIEMSFSSETEKQEFDESLEGLKQWANMKTVTQFLQFAMKQLQELRSQGQAFITTEHAQQKTKSKRKVKKYPAEHAISATDSEDIEIFATCVPSLQHLVNQAHDIGARGLPSPRLSLTKRAIHAGIFTLENGDEPLVWRSSPTLQNTDSFLVNYRLAVGMLCSGVSNQKYERFTKAANFGEIRPTFMEEKCMPGVSAAVGKAVQESTETAVADVCLRCPSGTEVETHCETSVVSEKRHTTVLAMDTDSHKILGSVIITKNDDPAAKNNDTKDDDVIGSQKLLRTLIEKGVVIRSSKTTNGTSNQKVITNGNPAPVDEHMIWKAIRDDLKNYPSIKSGLQKDMARTWHPELADKEDGIRKQLYRSLRYSNGDSNLLRRGLCAIPRHYQGSHELCHMTSPCRQLATQNASYDRIKDMKALQILTVFIQQTNLYRYPSMIIEHIKSTSHRQPPKVSLKTFCGDGSSVSIPVYNLRTGLFVLWWNENSHIHGSQSHASLDNMPTTCHYAHDIWKKFLAKIS